MSTVDQLRVEIYEAVGGRNDAVVETAALRGLNAAVYASALLFEPYELRLAEDLTATAAARFTTYTSLTRPFKIEQVENVSNSYSKVWSLDYQMLNVAWLPTTGSVKYYAIYGNRFYYKPVPTSDETLKIFFMSYPARLTAGADNWPFSIHEDFGLALATSWVHAVLEEKDSSDIWSSVASSFGIPEAAQAKIKRLMIGEWSLGDNIQRTVQQSSVKA